MKIIVLSFLFLGSLNSLSQEKDKLKISQLGVELGREYNRHGSQNHESFENDAVHKEFVLADSNIAPFRYGNAVRYSFLNFGVNIGLKKPNKKLYWLTGLQFDYRSDRRYNYKKQESFFKDTVQITSFESGEVDTLFVDSTTIENVSYAKQTINLFASFEGLYDLEYKNFELSFGLGCGFGYSMKSSVISDYSLSVSEALYSNSQRVGVPLYYSELSYSYGGDAGNLASKEISRELAYTESSMRLYLKPYVPLRISHRLGKKGGLAKHSIVYVGKVGLEMQMEFGGGFDSRFFHSHQISLIRKI